MWEFISELSILFRWSTCLFKFQYHIVFLFFFFYILVLIHLELTFLCDVKWESNCIISKWKTICPKTIYLFYFWLCWVFSSCEGFLQLRHAGTALHRGAWAFHYCGPSRCGAQAPDAQAQQLWHTGPAAPRHVGSSQTRTRTRVPCISRQTLNHCATREAHHIVLITVAL